jgi:hypothetical protein
MRVKLSPEQLRLLEDADETKGLLDSFLVRGDTLALEGCGYPLAEFRSAIEDLLIRIGFDADYKLNPSGQLLEDLIDKLFE